MAFLLWSDALTLGIPTVDDQHRELVAIVNEAHAVFSTGAEASRLVPIFDRLERYAAEHFATEEALFERAGYPDRAAHAAQHRSLTAQVRRLRQDLDAGDPDVALELMDMLRSWLVRHISSSDRAYATYLAGLEPS
jgi:hemerythrin